MPNSRWSRIGNAAQASIGLFMVFHGVHAPVKIPLIICISNHLPRSSVYQEIVVPLRKQCENKLFQLWVFNEFYKE